MKSIVHAALAAVLSATAVPAAADEGGRQVLVSYGDLDLTNAQGIARLKQRVQAAVQSVCRADDIALKERLRQRSCVKRSGGVAEQAVARAVIRATQAQAHARAPAAIPVGR